MDEPFTLICSKSTGDSVSWWFSNSRDGANPVYISLGGTLSSGYRDRFHLDGDNLTFDTLQLNDTGYYICLEKAGFGDRHVTYLFVSGNFTPVLYNYIKRISISALLIVWRIRGQIIRTVLCCIVYCICAKSPHLCQQFLCVN